MAPRLYINTFRPFNERSRIQRTASAFPSRTSKSGATPSSRLKCNARIAAAPRRLYVFLAIVDE